LIIPFTPILQAVDFLDKLLRYDHQDRLTAREAMVCIHPLVEVVDVLQLPFNFLCKVEKLNIHYMQFLDFILDSKQIRYEFSK